MRQLKYWNGRGVGRGKYGNGTIYVAEKAKI